MTVLNHCLGLGLGLGYVSFESISEAYTVYTFTSQGLRSDAAEADDVCVFVTLSFNAPYRFIC